MFSALAVTWVTLNITGQWCMLLLLGTYLLVKDLPGRKNVFMLNFLMTTFLVTIPPCLLFYAGQQDGEPSHWLCVTQSVLMDGIAPMFGMALLVLVFQTWAELRAVCGHKWSMVATSPAAKWTLLSFPYVTLIGWCTASLFQAFLPPTTITLSQFIYCDNISFSPRGRVVRERVGPFIIACGVLELFFETWIACMILTREKPNAVTRSSATYQASLHLYGRISAFTLLQFIPVVLALMNKISPAVADGVQIATQVIEATVSVTTFIVFASRKAILQSWKLWPAERNRTVTQSRIDVAAAMA